MKDELDKRRETLLVRLDEILEKLNTVEDAEFKERVRKNLVQDVEALRDEILNCKLASAGDVTAQDVSEERVSRITRALYRISRFAELGANLFAGLDTGLEDVLHNLFNRALQPDTDFDAVFAINDEMAMSAASVTRAMGRDDIIVVGYDATERGLAGLKKGDIAATICQCPHEMGRRGLITALRVLEGLPIGPETKIPLKLMTSDTVDITVDALELPRVSRRYRVGVALGDFESSPFYRDVREGIYDVARGAGVDVVVKGHHETLAQSQANDVEEMVNQGVDALVVVPLNEYTLSPIVRRALEAGIPVITLDQSMAEVKTSAHVGTDNVEGGRIAASFIGEQLEGKGRVAVVYSYMFTSRQRRQGFEEEMQARFPGMSVVPYRVLTSDYEMGEMALLSMFRSTDIDHWWIALANSTGETDASVTLQGVAGNYPALPPELMHYSVTSGDVERDMAAQCLVERRYIVVNDPLRSQRSLFGLQGEERLRAGKFVVVPMIVEKGKVAGVICLGRSVDGADIGYRDIQLAEALSSQTSAIIRNYLLLEERERNEKELKKYRFQLEELVEARTAELKAEVSERRRVEEALRQYQEMLQLVMDNIPQYIFWKDLNSAYLGCNKSFAETAGLESPEAIVGKTDYDFAWKSEDADSFHDVDRRVMETDKPEYHIIERRVREGGKHVWLDTSKIPLHDAEGNVVGILGSVEDITERKHAEDALQSSLERFRVLADNVAAGVVIYQLVGDLNSTQKSVIKHASRRGMEMLGYDDSDNIIGRDALNFAPEEVRPELEEMMRRRFAGEDVPTEYETLLQKKDGSIINVFMKASVVEYEGNASVLMSFVDVTPVKEAEHQAREAFTLLDAALATMPLAVLELDMDAKITRWNDSAEKIFGWSAGEAIGHNMYDFIVPDSVEGQVREVLASLEEQPTNVNVNENVTRNGERVLCEWYNSALFDAEGEIVGMLCIAVDITERVRAEEAMKAAEWEKRTILDSQMEHVVYQDRNHEMLWVNKAACESVGATREELIGRHCYEVWQWSESRCENCPIERAIETGEMQELESSTPDGRLWYIRGYPVTGTDGEIVGGIEIRRDITGQKESQRQTQEALELVNTTIDLLPIVFMEIDKENRVTRWNDSAEQVFGWKEEEVLGHDIYDFLVTPETHKKVRGLLDELEETPNLGNVDENLTKSGKRRLCEWYNSLLYDAEGNISRILCIALDITDRVESERQLARFFALAENASDAISITYLNHEITYANPAFYRLHGYEPGEEGVTGLVISDFIAPESYDVLGLTPEDILEKMLSTGSFSAEFRHVRKDGSTFEGFDTAFAIFDEAGEPMAIANILRDITTTVMSREFSARVVRLSTARELSDALLEIVTRYANVDRGVFVMFEGEERGVPEFGRVVADRSPEGVVEERLNLSTPLAQDPAALWVYESRGTVVVNDVENPPLEVPSGQVERMRKSGVRRVMGIPVTLRDEVVGAVFLSRMKGVDFTPVEVETFEAIANQFALALESAMLQEERQHQTELELRRRAQEVATTTEVAQQIAAATALDDLYRRVVTLIKERFGYYHAQVFRYDPSQDAMVVVEGYGEAGRKMKEARHKLLVGKGVVGTAAATGEPVLATDTNVDPDWVPNPNLPMTKGELAVPIRLGREVLGILDVQSDVAGALSQEDVVLLQGLCGQIATAIQTTRLVRETQDALGALDATHQLYVREAWREYLAEHEPLRRGGYVLREDEVVAAERNEAKPGISLAAKKRGSVILGASSEKMRGVNGGSLLVSPLKLRDQIIGAIELEDPSGGRRWTQEDVRLVEEIVSEVSQAVENARLFEESRVNLEEASVLYQASRAFNEAETMDDILGAIVEYARPYGVSYVGLVMFEGWNKEGAHYFNIESYWHTEEFAPSIPTDTPLPLERFPLMLTTEEPLFISRFPEDEAVDEVTRHSMKDSMTRTLALIPLRVGRRFMGHVLLGGLSPLDYSDYERRILAALAGQATVTLQNRRLFEEVRTALEESTVLYEVSRALNSAETIDDVLEAVVSFAMPEGAVMANFSIFEGWDREGAENLVFESIWTAGGFKFPLPAGAVTPLSMFPLMLDATEPMYIRDSREDDRVDGMTRRTNAELGVVALAVLPLRVGRRWLGNMVFAGPEPKEYTEYERRILEAVAGQAAVTLQTRHLFDEVNRGLEESSTLYELSRALNVAESTEDVLNAIVKYARPEDVPLINLSIFEGWNSEGAKTFSLEGLWAAPNFKSPLSVGMVLPVSAFPAIRKLTEPVFIKDVREDDILDEVTVGSLLNLGLITVATLPLRVGRRWLGDLILAGPEPKEYTDYEKRLLESVAGQAAIRLQSRRLFEEVQQGLEETSTLYEASRALNQAESVDDVLRAVVEHVKPEGASMANFVIFEGWDREGAENVVFESIWTEPDYHFPLESGMVTPLSELPVVLIASEPMYIENVQEDDRLDEVTKRTNAEFGTVTLVLLPLRVGRSWLGALAFAGPAPVKYTEYERRILEAIAGQAAVTLQTRHLFGEAQRRARREATIREVTANLSRANDIDTLLQSAVRELGRVVGSSRTYVQLGTEDDLLGIGPGGTDGNDDGDGVGGV